MKFPEFNIEGFGVRSIALSVERKSRDELEISIDLRVAHATANPGDADPMVRFRRTAVLAMSQDALKHYVRAAVRDAVMHEIDEWLFCDGALMKDPHPELPGYAQSRKPIDVRR